MKKADGVGEGAGSPDGAGAGTGAGTGAGVGAGDGDGGCLLLIRGCIHLTQIMVPSAANNIIIINIRASLFVITFRFITVKIFLALDTLASISSS